MIKKKFLVSELFYIDTTKSFNKDALEPYTKEEKYEYVTRTSENNGVSAYTGYVNDTHLNSGGTFSLGLLQLDIFYREKKWYAGQFVRKITPKFEMNEQLALYFQTVLNKLKPVLQKGLVRDIDDAFLNEYIELPVKQIDDNNPDFSYMEAYIKKIQKEVIAEIKKELDLQSMSL
ncbi:restriction endonuclease subunit S [Listeria welshimeri]|nr:restriction endonuclease subunit S [Listeria welshimeri]MBC1631199.1 restriction endonuclease subunit S [Listeria welshimeri]MBC1667449.1 restriction endonuclease subunit S [Listeria welshimeri]MBC1697409.1 restriction endonuclease subunit S [Listeria welshimeri]MBC2354136.1 restriction endonuclease subunit S [Listeria welshimeri]